MIVLAHAGHWLPQLLYLAPVIVLVGLLAVSKLKERRHAADGRDPRLQRGEGREGEPPAPSSG